VHIKIFHEIVFVKNTVMYYISIYLSLLQVLSIVITAVIQHGHMSGGCSTKHMLVQICSINQIIQTVLQFTKQVENDYWSTKLFKF